MKNQYVKGVKKWKKSLFNDVFWTDSPGINSKHH